MTASETASPPAITSHAALVTQMVGVTGASESTAVRATVADSRSTWRRSPKAASPGDAQRSTAAGCVGRQGRAALLARGAVGHAGRAVAGAGRRPRSRPPRTVAAGAGAGGRNRSAGASLSAVPASTLLGDLSQRIQVTAHPRRTHGHPRQLAPCRPWGSRHVTWPSMKKQMRRCRWRACCSPSTHSGCRELYRDTAVSSDTASARGHVAGSDAPRAGGAAALLSESPAWLHVAGCGCPRGCLHRGLPRADQHGAGRLFSASRSAAPGRWLKKRTC